VDYSVDRTGDKNAVSFGVGASLGSLPNAFTLKKPRWTAERAVSREGSKKAFFFL